MEELIKNLKDYVTLLDSEFPKDVTVNIFQKTFMDFAFRNREIIKAIIKLLDSYENEDFLFLPLASILRLLSTDTLAIYYLITFLSDNLKEKQITFENELDALRVESIISMDKIIEYENELGLSYIKPIRHDANMYKLNNKGSKILKNREDFHLNSNRKILKNYNNTRKFLIEEAKINRVKEFIEDENVTDNIFRLFKNYKY
jgi:ABC-type antimicrobial peptide transport system permease subunit